LLLIRPGFVSYKQLKDSQIKICRRSRAANREISSLGTTDWFWRAPAMQFGKVAIPTGLNHFSPGLAAAAYPGWAFHYFISNPEGG
jgi:hypothetical protein